jgi:uncharacterized membrane protein
MFASPLVQEPVAVLAVLLAVLAGLFGAASTRAGSSFFKIVPLLVFAYFVPTALSNTGVIPLESDLYDFTKSWLLPASLILFTMSVDIPAVMRLGPKQLALFFAGTATIVIGGPLAYLALGWLLPAGDSDQAWRGLAALSGSWIGGGANFVAIGESVKASDAMLGKIIVVDVALANIWMAVLLFFAAREEGMDRWIGVDRTSLEELRRKSEEFQLQVARSATLPDLFQILFLAFAGTVIAATAAAALAPIIERHAPDGVSDILSEFAWKVLIATAIGIGISYTRLRNLEGAGASKIGSVFLYLLVTTIGAKAQFAAVFEVPILLAIAAIWITFHAVVLLLLRWLLRAPIFCMAVGSQANIGGAASAPVVAAAFHPALAPVGVLMGVVGYALGTAAGLVCAALLQWVHGLY